MIAPSSFGTGVKFINLITQKSIDNETITEISKWKGFFLFRFLIQKKGKRYSQYRQNSQCGHLEELPPSFQHCSQSCQAYNSLDSSSHMEVAF